MVPLSFAVVSPTLDAAFVLTAGAAEETKLWSPPRAVPASFVATTRKWYVLPVVRPVTVAETFEAPVPEPASFTGVFVP